MPTTWSPADKNAGITLSNGNLTATGSGATGSWRSVRSTTSFSTGLWYIEVTKSASDGSNGFMFGLMNATASLSAYAGSDNNGVGFQMEGSIWKNGAQVVAGTAANGYVGTNSVPNMAIDLTHKKIWFYSTQTGLWNNGAIGAQNPATNTGGIDITSLGTPVFIAFSAYNSGSGSDVGILNAGATSFVRAPPAGFVGPDAPVSSAAPGFAVVMA